MITTTTATPTTEPETNAQDTVAPVERVKLDNVSGGWGGWGPYASPYGGPYGGWGPSSYGASPYGPSPYGPSPYAAARYAAYGAGWYGAPGPRFGRWW